MACQFGGTQKSFILTSFRNASSLPPRLPMLSKVIMAVANSKAPVNLIVVALSYRGFWQSRGTPSQRGIEKDAQAALAWTRDFANTLDPGLNIFLWGQSIGASVAAWTAANQPSVHQCIRGLILETPFVSIKDMLVALYPQKWLPYRYLWPFLRNWWDNNRALTKLAAQDSPPPLLILSAGKDEVVPSEHGDALANNCRTLALPVEFQVVQGALHHEVMTKPEGRTMVSSFFSDYVVGPNALQRSPERPSPRSEHHHHHHYHHKRYHT